MINHEPKIPDNVELCVSEAAAILGISLATLWRHTKSGLIHCQYFRANGRKRYRGSEIKRYWRATY